VFLVSLPPAPPALAAPAPVRDEVQALFARPRIKRITANGLAFSYVEWGDPRGPLVLCLHGFPDSPATWNDLAPGLARAGYRVVAPWTRGYYPSEVAVDGDDSAATLGRDALALIGALGAKQAVLIGHDWGALAAYAAATLAPERVSKLVVVAIPHPKAITQDAIFGRANHFMTLPLPGAARSFAANNTAAWTKSSINGRPIGTPALVNWTKSNVPSGRRAVPKPFSAIIARLPMKRFEPQPATHLRSNSRQ
jgi:pimeloyl-ACP methyl ester carboxylesterase